MKIPTLRPSEAKLKQEYYCKDCNRKFQEGWLKSCKKGTWCTCKCKKCVEGEDVLHFSKNNEVTKK